MRIGRSEESLQHVVRVEYKVELDGAWETEWASVEDDGAPTIGIRDEHVALELLFEDEADLAEFAKCIRALQKKVREA